MRTWSFDTGHTFTLSSYLNVFVKFAYLGFCQDYSTMMKDEYKVKEPDVEKYFSLVLPWLALSTFAANQLEHLNFQSFSAL